MQEFFLGCQKGGTSPQQDWGPGLSFETTTYLLEHLVNRFTFRYGEFNEWPEMAKRTCLPWRERIARRARWCGSRGLEPEYPMCQRSDCIMVAQGR
jgi:hypothetical protein